MSSLTDEQRRRIEENKQKALALRAAKRASTQSNPSPAPSNSGGQTSSAPKSGNNAAHTAWNSFKPSSNTTTISLPAANNNVFNFQRNAAATSSAKSNGVPASMGVKNFYAEQKQKLILVKFVLISKERFAVDFTFDKNIIEIIKTINNKLYDPNTTRWSFLLQEHDNVKAKLEAYKDAIVKVSPLPKYILKIFREAPKVTTDYKTIDISRIDSTLLSFLFPFQKEGVQFGISKCGRCIIADDMGLGKTIQALGIAHYYSGDWPLLIVCPSSMRYQWEQEIMNYLPAIPLTRIFVMCKSKEQIHNPLILITSYDLMSRCESTLMAQKFGVIIMDESHSMKSLKTQRTKTALNLIGKAQRCILLSGTPALSRPMELYPQIKAIEPRAFSIRTNLCYQNERMSEFGLRYCDGTEGRFGWDYTGASNTEELKILLETKFMIRRLKSAVLNQLPSKIRQVVILDDEMIKKASKEMEELASKLNNETIKGIERRGTLLQYYAETAKTKLKAIKEYICQLLETGSKFLVFAHHKLVLDEVCTLLDEKETYFIRIDGKVSSDERKSVCDQFQTEDRFRVAVLSITAASTGLTLTAANLVVFAELFWNPGILTQAEDRVHRIGQQDSVLVQYLIARNTADDHLWSLIKEKMGFLNQAGLSKDNFSCESTVMKVLNEQKTITEYFAEMEDLDLSLLADEVEEMESKRIKLSE